MGYSVCSTHGKRTCDICDECPSCMTLRTGKAIRMHLDKCPSGWCSTLHVCPDCKASRKDKLHARHDKCAEYSAAFHLSENLKKEAEAMGLPVIKAGVNLPGGVNVYAWTTKGNFEVLHCVYDEGLQRPDHVLDIRGAIQRHDERPAEVYHA